MKVSVSVLRMSYEESKSFIVGAVLTVFIITSNKMELGRAPLFASELFVSENKSFILTVFSVKG